MKQGWEIKKLGEVCEVIGGSTPKTNEPTYWDGDFFWVTPAELDGTKLISSTKRTITEAGIKSAHLQLLPAGTVLLSSRAPIGKVAITTVPMYCNQGFKNIICSDKLYNCYVYWFLYANTEYLNALGTGATFKEISKKVVEQIPIPVPPLPIQEQIVSELDLLSGIIEKKREQLKELDALAQSIFYDMFGDPITNEKGWEVKKLGEVADIVGGSTPKTNIKEYWNGDNYWVTPAELHGTRYISSTERCITDLAVDKAHLTQLPIGTVLLSSRAPIGKVCITRVPMYCNQGFKNIICSDKLNSEYVYQYLIDKTEFLNSLGTGATFKEISKTTTENITIPIPPLPLQHQFATKIEAIEKQKELIKQSISETETLFNARMQEHFG